MRLDMRNQAGQVFDELENRYRDLTHDEMVALAVDAFTPRGTVEIEVQLTGQHCLYYADLVCYGPERVYLVEVKSRKEANRVGQAVRQFKTYAPLLEAQAPDIGPVWRVLWIEGVTAEERKLLTVSGIRVLVDGPGAKAEWVGE